MNDSLTLTEFGPFMSLFSQLANQTNLVCWIRSLDYNRQLYLNDQYNLIWGQKKESLFEDPDQFYDFLLPNDLDDISHTMKFRANHPDSNNGDNTVFYRIKHPDEMVCYIRDWSLLVSNKQGKPIAVAGVAEKMSPERWHSEIQNEQPSATTPRGGIDNIYKALIKEQSTLSQNENSSKGNELVLITCFNANGLEVNLTKREAQCVQYLIQGKSAKQTAELLFLSPRTIEMHLENIKQKACCRTKLELVSFLLNN